MSKDTDENQPVAIEDEIKSIIDEAAKPDEEKPEVDDEEIEDTGGEDTESDETADTGSDEDEEDLQEDVEEYGEPDEAEKLEAPEHWEASHREVFNSQTPEAQEFLLERHKSMEGVMTRKTQELASVSRQFDDIKNALAPYETEFRSKGLDHAGAVRALAAWDTKLRTGGKAAVLELAQAYGVDLDAEDEYIDPSVKAVQDQLRELQTHNAQAQHAAQQEQQNRVLNEMQSFQQETDASGKLLHPHYEALAGDMATLVLVERQKGNEIGLHGAYEKALLLRPDLSAPKPTPVEKVNQAQKVRKAKKAATGIKSSGAVGKKARETMTLEEEIASHIN